MKKIVALLLLVCFAKDIQAQRTDKKLQRQVEALLQGFNGQAGLYVKDLRRNRVVAINADTIFPTASVVKLPILAGVMDKLQKGELDYHQQLRYRDSLAYSPYDMLASYKDTSLIELSRLIMLMITTSDNSASLWLQSLAGGGLRINAILDSLGFLQTRVNSRTPGREAFRSLYGWGQTTPREIATLLERIANGEVVSKERSAQMLRILGRALWDEVALAPLPPDVFVASKYGAVNETRNEVVYVNGGGARYVFCILTKNNKDKSWAMSNEAWELTRKVSKLLWDHFSR